PNSKLIQKKSALACCAGERACEVSGGASDAAIPARFDASYPRAGGVDICHSDCSSDRGPLLNNNIIYKEACMKKLSSANLTLILSFLLLSFGPRVFAQLGAAGISGAVTDQQGAAVVGADVTVKNKATGQTRKMKSGADGIYRLQNLPPAVYEIRV